MIDSLRNAVLDGMLDGFFGKGLIVTRREMGTNFPEFAKNYTGCFLSNSEMITGTHSPTYKHFTQRITEGVYRVHPEALAARLKEREQTSAPL